MAIKVLDEIQYPTIGLSLTNVVLTIKNTYSVLKNEGVTNVNYNVYYYTEASYNNSELQPFSTVSRSLIVPEEETNNIPGYIYSCLHTEYPGSVDF